MSYVLDRWTVDNPDAEVPRVTTSPNRNGVFSDFYVEDGSFLRVRNIQIGYILPKNGQKSSGLIMFDSMYQQTTFSLLPIIWAMIQILELLKAHCLEELIMVSIHKQEP
ncbi:MAG: hypothetical protein CM15mP65_06120 [Crocinitomicaceae bacterium]|nr:MAG: hypothetical protein CM15mP65_06120 [Crocinitomicaceae bacterium]